MKILSVLACAAVVAACGAQSSSPFKVEVPEVPTTGFEEGWPYSRAPEYPVGTWTSASGYRIELENDGTYRVCLQECDEGRYERRNIAVSLRDFNVPEKPVAQSLVEAVNSDSRRARDLDFTPNMGPPANAADCGGRPCVQLGAWSPRHEYTFILQD